MNRSCCYKLALLVMWLALPTSAWSYWHVWERLPGRMAIHFDANWQPNGFATRERALQLGLGILIVMLVVFTVATLAVLYLKPLAVAPVLLISYVVVGFCWYGNYSIVKFNLNAQAAHSELVGTISPARSDSEQLVSQMHS
jgi:hypothetical protein